MKKDKICPICGFPKSGVTGFGQFCICDITFNQEDKHNR